MRRLFFFTPTSRWLVLWLISALLPSARCDAADKKPLKVFILVGQSNMQGHASIKTFDHMGMDPKTAPLLGEMQHQDGTPRVCQSVWISSLSTNGIKEGALTTGFGADGNKIGPELTFGITVQKMLGGPILLIKAAWGGKSLHTDFRPPSAGPYVFSEAQIENLEKRGEDMEAIKVDKQKVSGECYRLTLAHVKKVLANIPEVCPDYEPEQGYDVCGLVWFQGWNDMVDRGTYPDRASPGGYDEYSRLMGHFIRDMRKDLELPGLPVVIGVMGVGGPVENYGPDQQRYQSTHQNFRKAMAAPARLPEFKGNVSADLTEKYWDMELDGLVARNERVKQELRRAQKENKLSSRETQELGGKLRNKEFSQREAEILGKGISNAAYHYLGSAKIMAGIGKGFAEAVIDLQAQ